MTSDSTAAKVADSGEAAFFLETLNGEADGVFRFAYAITLNFNEADQLLKNSYKRILGEISQFIGGNHLSLRLQLLRTAWGIFRETEASSTYERATTEIFGDLDSEYRAALTLVDGMGLTAKEAQQIMGVEDDVFRHWLAEARQVMVRNAKTKE